MNYLKTYNHFYEKAHTITKRIVITEMKKSKEKNRPFLTVHNKICNELNNYYTKKYTEVLRNTNNDSFNLFNDRYSYYQGENDDVIKWILENEINESFKTDNTILYKRFIADLAIESSLKEAQRHYRNYKDYYELIYDLDMYSNFFFHDFDGISFTSSFYFKNMLDIKHPYLKKERENLLKGQNSKDDLKVNKIERKTASSTDTDCTTKDLLESFTDDERYLLINIMFSVKNDPTFKLTDFMKIIKIVGAYHDYSILYKSPKDVTSYSKVSKGINYYSGDGQLKII